MPSSQDDTLQAEDDTKLDPLSDLAYQVNLYYMNYVVRVYCPSCICVGRNDGKLLPNLQSNLEGMKWDVKNVAYFVESVTEILYDNTSNLCLSHLYVTQKWSCIHLANHINERATPM